jgi:flagellin
MNRMQSALESSEVLQENTATAQSRIRDADFAFETAQMSRAQIMQQAGVAVLGQANGMNQSILRLL